MFRMPWLAPTIALGIAAGLSSSCAEPNPALVTVEKASSAGTVFSDDDRRAAQALSIGNARALATTNDPLDQAVLCSLAIGEVADRLRTAGMGLSQQQIGAVTIAQQIYDKRALAAARNAPADAIASARARMAEAHPEPSARALTAVACLRQLA